MVEGAPLLREYTRKGIVGSNPIFSAIIFVSDPDRQVTILTEDIGDNLVANGVSISTAN